MYSDTRFNFHHNFSEPVRIEGSGLYYNPARVDQFLTRIQSERGNSDADNRNASTTRR